MILIPTGLFLLLAAFGCWGILVFIKGIRNGNIKVVPPSAPHNSAMDAMPPTCSQCPVDEALCGSGRGYPKCKAALELMSQHQ